jgi:hypothetical protein
LAAFISSDEQMANFVCRWSEAAYRRGSASPRVRSAPFFYEVQDFASYLDGMIKLAGYAAEDFS